MVKIVFLPARKTQPAKRHTEDDGEDEIGFLEEAVRLDGWTSPTFCASSGTRREGTVCSWINYREPRAENRAAWSTKQKALVVWTRRNQSSGLCIDRAPPSASIDKISLKTVHLSKLLQRPWSHQTGSRIVMIIVICRPISGLRKLLTLIIQLRSRWNCSFSFAPSKCVNVG